MKLINVELRTVIPEADGPLKRKLIVSTVMDSLVYLYTDYEVYKFDYETN